MENCITIQQLDKVVRGAVNVVLAFFLITQYNKNLIGMYEVS